MQNELAAKIGLPVLVDEPLKKYTTFKIGGPAKFFVVVNNKAQLFKAVKAAVDLKIPFIILGGGSNVLVADKGIDGLVIKLENGETEVKGGRIKVFAGNLLGSFIREAVKSGYGDLEFAANIPGTVGGAVYGNAGAYGQGVGDFVDEVEVIVVDHEVGLKVLAKEECGFAYRESIFKQNKNWIIAEVAFALLQDENGAEKLKQIDEEWKKRLDSQPLDLPSAGCSFKNILYSDELKKFESWAVKGLPAQASKLPAAKFIEEAGLKGKKIGGAMVSDKHANFILNFNNATADDVVQLISLVKTKVRDEFGVQLEEEVQCLGF